MLEPVFHTCPYCGHFFEAKNALDDINPVEIRYAVRQFNEAVSDSFHEIESSLEDVQPELEDSVRIETTTLAPDLAETYEFINQTSVALRGSRNPDAYYDAAVQVHDRLQKEYNDYFEREYATHIELEKIIRQPFDRENNYSIQRGDM